ncbi:endonuclease [Metamycoplasma canadense]|uniref:endonuclease n=1 Tax=Metamycoplasma canadense TaxID=29554 RepID=UPI00064523E0|nr:endonuclease [Metamycoplasma canadense]
MIKHPPPHVNQTINNDYIIEYDSSNNFYSSLEGLSGETLRNKLFELQLQNRTKTPGYSNLFETYKDAFVDKYYENDGSVLDLYTEIPNGKDKYNFYHGKFRDIGNEEGKGMNREHIIAQSWFGKKAGKEMRNDAHHVWPSDKQINSIHGNIPFGQTKNGRIVSSNGTKIGIGIEDNEKVFEVIDEFKGDVGRAILYFVLTYRDRAIAKNHPGQRVFVLKNGKYNIRTNFLKTYLNWHKLDGISQFDIDRNNGIYKHQQNRNPFTDYPELIKVYFENDNNFVFKNKGIAVKIIKNNK